MASNFFNKASLIMVPDAPIDGKLPSVKPEDRSGDFTFSRGSNTTATRVNKDGLIEKGRVNWINYSNDFSQWNLNLMPNGIDPAYTVTSGQEGYDGTNNAWRLELNFGGVIAMSTSHLSPDEIHTLSFYAKKGTLDYVYVEVRSIAEAFFNIGNGTLGGYYNYSYPDVLDRSIQDVGNGWYRCVMTFAGLPLSSNSIRISFTEDPVQWGASVGDYTFLQHVQFESGLVETDYIEAGATEGSAGLLEDEPRIDFHDPNSSAPSSCGSLLLEPQRTNHIWFSEWFGAWDSFSTLLTHKDGISPSGYKDATKLYIPADNANVYIRTQFYNVANETHIGSIFLKKVDGDEVRLRLSGNAPNIEGGAIFNLSNGTYRDAVGSVTPSIENYGNGWYRCSVGDLGGATVATPAFRIDALGTGYAPTVYVWGAQVETGNYKTSYITNHYNWIVTRSRDQANNSSLNPILGNGNISVMYDFIYDVVGREGSGQIFLLYSNNNSLGIKGTQSTDRRLQLFSYGDFIGTIGFNENVPYQTRHKVVLRVTGEVVELFYNGIKQNGTIDASALGGVYNWSRIKLDPTNAFLAGLNQLATFPTALTDEECIALTTI